MICIDCGTEYEGSYCPKCGQPASTKRITVKETLRSIFASFLMGDNKFMHTAGQILCRPGTMTCDYIYGRRAKLMAPVPMLVRLVAIFLLITMLFNIEISTYRIIDETVTSNIKSPTLIVFADFLGRILSNKVLFSLFSATLFVSNHPISAVF